jgi:hypothetical protein
VQNRIEGPGLMQEGSRDRDILAGWASRAWPGERGLAEMCVLIRLEECG